MLPTVVELEQEAQYWRQSAEQPGQLALRSLSVPLGTLADRFPSVALEHRLHECKVGLRGNKCGGGGGGGGGGEGRGGVWGSGSHRASRSIRFGDKSQGVGLSLEIRGSGLV